MKCKVCEQDKETKTLGKNEVCEPCVPEYEYRGTLNSSKRRRRVSQVKKRLVQPK